MSPSWAQTRPRSSLARLPWMIAFSWQLQISSTEFFRVLGCAHSQVRSKLNSHVNATLLGTTNTGKSILITGAGDCIGSALAQSLASSSPRFLILLDHSEQSLHEINMQLAATGKSSYAAILGNSGWSVDDRNF